MSREQTEMLRSELSIPQLSLKVSSISSQLYKLLKEAFNDLEPMIPEYEYVKGKKVRVISHLDHFDIILKEYLESTSLNL